MSQIAVSEFKQLFSLNRINRARFLMLGCSLQVVLLALLLLDTLGAHQHFSIVFQRSMAIVLGAVSLFNFVMGIILQLRRLKDIGVSLAWIALPLVCQLFAVVSLLLHVFVVAIVLALVLIGYSLFIMFKSGSKEQNRYGEASADNTKKTYILMVLAMVLTVALVMGFQVVTGNLVTHKGM